MRSPSSLLLALNLFMVSAAFTFAGSAEAGDQKFEVLPPGGFEGLAAERQLVIDAYFGGKKLGEVSVTVSPGQLSFDDPAALAALLPGIKSAAVVATALSGQLDAHSALACRSDEQVGCRTLAIGQTGIIFDEERFRVDIFLNPTMLAPADSASKIYLDAPESQPALISRFGATLSGSSRGDRNYHFQNRSIASIGALRLQSDSSIGSGSGAAFDNLTIQRDSSAQRMLGGVFWAPGSELIGRRKIIGAGLTTQFDTRIDKTTLAGIPLTVFLQQPGRVDVLLDGKVILSRIYSAGNRSIDTGALPDGSYEVVLRIREDGQPERTERRFFSKGSTMAPVGHPTMAAFVGFLQTQREGLSIGFDKLFYEASVAYRVGPALGIDAKLVGVDDKALLEAGAVFSTGFAHVRLVGLATSSGDTGAAIRASTYGRSALSASFDLRAINSREGRELLPVSSSGNTFSEDPLLGAGMSGSYVQALGVVDYRFRQASLRLSGFYRRDGQAKATYNFGASLEAPLVRRSLWDVRLQADLRKTDQDIVSFIGLRFLAFGGATALSGTTGLGHRSGASGKSTSFIGETQAAWNHQLGERSDVSTDLAFGHGADGSYVRGSGNLRSPFANLRADGSHQFTSGGDTTQVVVTADSAIAVGQGKWAVGALDMSDAAAVASVSGATPDQEFDVIVDEMVRGTIKGSGSVPIYLAPYSSYEMRLRPRTNSTRGLSDGVRSATLYPGNVIAVHWSVTPLFVYVGRIIGPDGRPIVNADMRGSHAIGRTDDDGYFQVEAREGEEIKVGAGDAPCKVTLPDSEAGSEFSSIGDIRCG